MANDAAEAQVEQPVTNEAVAEEALTEDDWGAAMAEQTAAESSVLQASNVEQAQVFAEFTPKNKLNETQNDIDFILDIPVQLTVELGRTKIAIKNLLQLAQGSVVELDRCSGEPVRLALNGKLLGSGELVRIEGRLGVRVLGWNQ